VREGFDGGRRPLRSVLLGRDSARRSSFEAGNIVLEGLRGEDGALKQVVADLTLENRRLRRSMSGAGEDAA
jgi:hypothetical protein